MSTYVSIVATHQARMRCLLSQIFKKKLQRFKNGAVVRIELRPNYVGVNLVHSGELGPDENKPNREYYLPLGVRQPPEDAGRYKPRYFVNYEYTNRGVTGDENYGHIRFEGNRIIIDVSKSKFFGKDHKSFEIDTSGNTYVFYFIRHGQGYHNVMGKVTKAGKTTMGKAGNSFGLHTNMYDPALTEIGELQAKNTGEVLRRNMEFMSAKFLFCSDLYRTMQTLTLILESSGFKDRFPAKRNIYVLPCSHELDYHKSGLCDGSGYFTGDENKSKCTDLNNDDKCVKYLNGYNITWSEYAKFYDGTRMGWKNAYSRNRCRNNNVLALATSIIINKVRKFDSSPRGVDESVDVIYGGKSKKKYGGSRKKSSVSKKTYKRPKKVTVSYKNKKKSIPKKYVKGLKGKERKAQIKSIFEGTDRPKTSAKEKRSQWVVKFEKKYNKKITNKSWIAKNIISSAGQKKIINKGIGAYYSSGSRPNQTGESWAYARLASVIMNGPSRKYDMDIWEKYKK